ncbi:hypothetical protein FB451DRAFT_312116 [Mycena latifolia]|nr:hypothetical protein FB451DRAFT_312116 [Mycena latifolia]
MSSIVTANLIKACLEIFLYGVYAVLFTAVIYLFRNRSESSPEKRPARWVLLGLVAQFLIITAHWINTIYNTFFGIVHLGGGTAAEAFYSNLSSPTAILHITFLVTCTLLTDLLVIHRLYVICSHRRDFVIFPLVLLVGQAVSGSGVIYRCAKSYTDEGFLIQYSLANPWVTTNLVLSILISTYSSAVLSWKIRGISRGLKRLTQHISGGAPLTSILAILVESAALQTTTTMGILVTFHVGFVGQVVWEGAAPAIFGISTVLIHARIGLGWAHEADRQIGSNPTRINFAINDTLEAEHELEDRRHK